MLTLSLTTYCIFSPCTAIYFIYCILHCAICITHFILLPHPHILSIALSLVLFPSPYHPYSLSPSHHTHTFQPPGWGTEGWFNVAPLDTPPPMKTRRLMPRRTLLHTPTAPPEPQCSRWVAVAGVNGGGSEQVLFQWLVWRVNNWGFCYYILCLSISSFYTMYMFTVHCILHLSFFFL